MDIVDLRITHFENTFIHNQIKKNPSRSMIIPKLKELGKYFVVVPVDKATNNVVVV